MDWWYQLKPPASLNVIMLTIRDLFLASVKVLYLIVGPDFSMFDCI